MVFLRVYIYNKMFLYCIYYAITGLGDKSEEAKELLKVIILRTLSNENGDCLR